MFFFSKDVLLTLQIVIRTERWVEMILTTFSPLLQHAIVMAERTKSIFGEPLVHLYVLVSESWDPVIPKLGFICGNSLQRKETLTFAIGERCLHSEMPIVTSGSSYRSLATMTLPPALAGAAGPRRGSMPLPIKHQLVRASAVDELDSPPSSPEVGSLGGASPAGGRGPYKVMLLGETGVGKTTLAAIFGGLKGGTQHEEEHTGEQKPYYGNVGQVSRFVCGG